MAIYGNVVGQGLRATREIALRQIAERSPESGVIVVEAPLTALAIAPDQIVNLASALEGWGFEAAFRKLARLRSRTLDGAKRVRVTLEDIDESHGVGYLNNYESPIGANSFGDGCAGILPHSGGGAFNGAGFFRASVAYLWDQLGARVAQVPIHAESSPPEFQLNGRARISYRTVPSTRA